MTILRKDYNILIIPGTAGTPGSPGRPPSDPYFTTETVRSYANHLPGYTPPGDIVASKKYITDQFSGTSARYATTQELRIHLWNGSQAVSDCFLNKHFIIKVRTTAMIGNNLKTIIPGVAGRYLAIALVNSAVGYYFIEGNPAAAVSFPNPAFDPNYTGSEIICS